MPDRQRRRLLLYGGPNDGMPRGAAAAGLGFLLAIAGLGLAAAAVGLRQGWLRGPIPGWISAIYASLFLGLGASLAARGALDFLRGARASPAEREVPDGQGGLLLRGFAEMAGFAAFLVPVHWLGWKTPGLDGLFIVALIFDGCWLFGAWRWARQLKARLRLGAGFLRYKAAAFHPGGRVELELLFPGAPEDLERLDITLRRVETESVSAPDGKSSRSFFQTYADTLVFGQDAIRGRIAFGMAVGFGLPADVLADEAEGPPHWEILVEGRGPGLRYECVFPVAILPQGVEPEQSSLNRGIQARSS